MFLRWCEEVSMPEGVYDAITLSLFYGRIDNVIWEDDLRAEDKCPLEYGILHRAFLPLFSSWQKSVRGHHRGEV